MNFGEAHSDHLQTAAETGLPGYALFVAGILVLALPARGKRADHQDLPARLGHSLRVPIATAIAVVTIAQFPLQLAAPRLMFLFLAAICIGLDER